MVMPAVAEETEAATTKEDASRRACCPCQAGKERSRASHRWGYCRLAAKSSIQSPAENNHSTCSSGGHVSLRITVLKVHTSY